MSWIESYDEDFVEEYILTIASLGPLHFIPDECDVERESVTIVTLEADTTSFAFIKGLPNFAYKVYLDTKYNFVGQTRSPVVPTATLEGGKVILMNLLLST